MVDIFIELLRLTLDTKNVYHTRDFKLIYFLTSISQCERLSNKVKISCEKFQL